MPADLKAGLYRGLKIALPILLSVVAIAFIGRAIDWNAALSSALDAPGWAVVSGIALILIQIALAGLRLRLLALSVQMPLSWQSSTAVWSFSYLGGLVLPTAVGSEIIKGAVLLKWARLPGRIIGVLVLERFVATVALVLLVLVTLPFASLRAGMGHTAMLGFLCGSGLLLIGLGFAARRRIGPGLSKLLVAFRVPSVAAQAISETLANAPLVKCIAISTVIHLLTLVVIGLLLFGFSSRDPFLDAILGGPVVTFAAMLPISVGGFGIREGAFILVFGAFGVDASRAAGVGLAWWGVQTLAGLTATSLAATWLAVNRRKRA